MKAIFLSLAFSPIAYNTVRGHFHVVNTPSWHPQPCFFNPFPIFPVQENVKRFKYVGLNTIFPLLLCSRYPWLAWSVGLVLGLMFRLVFPHTNKHDCLKLQKSTGDWEVRVPSTGIEAVAAHAQPLWESYNEHFYMQSHVYKRNWTAMCSNYEDRWLSRMGICDGGLSNDIATS